MAVQLHMHWVIITVSEMECALSDPAVLNTRWTNTIFRQAARQDPCDSSHEGCSAPMVTEQQSLGSTLANMFPLVVAISILGPFEGQTGIYHHRSWTSKDGHPHTSGTHLAVQKEPLNLRALELLKSCTGFNDGTNPGRTCS